jgi:hypothetical protein
MPRGISHEEEMGRISSKESNPYKSLTGFGPSKRFTSKGQSSNPTTGGGINRPTKGKGASSKNYSGSAQ